MVNTHTHGSARVMEFDNNISCLLVVRGVSPGCRLFGTASVVNTTTSRVQDYTNNDMEPEYWCEILDNVKS